MTLTGITLQSKIARFFNLRVLGENTFRPYIVFVEYR